MMKKTLVALAATAATGAFAQVAITGNIDMGFSSTMSQTPTSNTNGIRGGNTSTQSLGFSGSEDLGGGLKAGFKVETTINTASSTSLNAAGQTATFSDTTVWSGTPFNSEQFLSLSGGFGTVRAGVPNAAIFRAQGISQPFGTGDGSGYSSTYSRLGYTGSYGLSGFQGLAAGSGNVLRVIRMNNTIQYETPVMSGFSAMAEVAFGNDNQTSTTAFSANTGSFMGVLLNYANGPLTAVAAVNTYKAGTNDITGNKVLSTTTLTTATLAAGQDISYQFLGANYKMGASTFYTGLSNVSASDSTENSQSWNLAYKFALNANTDLMANVVSTSSSLIYSPAAAATGTAANTNKKLIGLGADYRLSKRTNLYARFESTDSNTDNASTGESTRTAIGVRHQF